VFCTLNVRLILLQILLGVIAPKPGSGLVRAAAKLFNLKSRAGLKAAQMRAAMRQVEKEGTGSLQILHPSISALFAFSWHPFVLVCKFPLG
jgi:hypothetical protein